MIYRLPATAKDWLCDMQKTVLLWVPLHSANHRSSIILRHSLFLRVCTRLAIWKAYFICGLEMQWSDSGTTAVAHIFFEQK